MSLKTPLGQHLSLRYHAPNHFKPTTLMSHVSLTI